MSDDNGKNKAKLVNQIEEYLKPTARNKNKKVSLSFEEIMGCFIGEFVIDVPDRAEIFVNDRVARSAYGLLKRTAILLENYFPMLEFKHYLKLCIANECQPKRICNLSQWYNITLIPIDKILSENRNKKTIYYSKSRKDTILFYLWQPQHEIWLEKKIGLNTFSKAEREKLIESKPTEKRKLIEKVAVEFGCYLFCFNIHPRQAIFDFITHVTCHALEVYSLNITSERRLDHLLNAHDYMAELILINIARSKDAQKQRTDALQELIIQKVSMNMRITVGELLTKLRDSIGHGVIEEIDDDENLIYFIQDGIGSHEALISGLTARFYRAKKTIKAKALNM